MPTYEKYFQTAVRSRLPKISPSIKIIVSRYVVRKSVRPLRARRRGRTRRPEEGGFKNLKCEPRGMVRKDGVYFEEFEAVLNLIGAKFLIF